MEIDAAGNQRQDSLSSRFADPHDPVPLNYSRGECSRSRVQVCGLGDDYFNWSCGLRYSLAFGDEVTLVTDRISMLMAVHEAK